MLYVSEVGENMLNKKNPEDSDSRMLKEILNGNPPLSEYGIDIAIRHAINSATCQFNSLVSDEELRQFHIEKYGYKLINLLKKKVKGRITNEDLSCVDRIRNKLNNVERKVDSSLRPKTPFSFSKKADFNTIKLVFIKLNYVIEMIYVMIHKT